MSSKQTDPSTSGAPPANRVVVIVPAFNEAGAIAGVVRDIQNHCDSAIVVIDDGSQDATAERARATGAVVLQHPCNLGIGGAVQTGYIYALRNGYDYVVRQDGDGQHDPSYISEMLGRVAAGEVDILVGSRFLAREGYQSTIVRRVGIVVLSLVSALIGTHTTDPTSGYWVLNRRALEALAPSHPDDYPETEALVIAAAAGCTTGEIPVAMRERRTGRSSIGALYSGFYMIKVILALLIVHVRPHHR